MYQQLLIMKAELEFRESERVHNASDVSLPATRLDASWLQGHRPIMRIAARDENGTGAGDGGGATTSETERQVRLCEYSGSASRRYALTRRESCGSFFITPMYVPWPGDPHVKQCSRENVQKETVFEGKKRWERSATVRWFSRLWFCCIT